MKAEACKLHYGCREAWEESMTEYCSSGAGEEMTRCALYIPAGGSGNHTLLLADNSVITELCRSGIGIRFLVFLPYENFTLWMMIV